MELTDLDLAPALEALGSGSCSSEELTRAHLEAMDGAAALNAFVTTTPGRALEMARASDARRARDAARPLDGVPLGIKDMFCTRGVETTACSRILRGFVPTQESEVTARLWRDGAVLLGKLNNDEFAMGSSNETSSAGAVLNPWRVPGGPALTPGGSSGGAAAAVAARLCPGAAGTDTGGSIRQPAALTGIVGLKPTYGRCSRRGIVAFASSLDQAGPMTRTVRDAAILLRSMAGHDPGDATCSTASVPDYAADLAGGVRGLRVGIPAEYGAFPAAPEVTALWEKGAAWLREAGAQVAEVALPHAAAALPAYYIIAPAEASSNLARYDGVRYGLRVDADDVDGMYAATRAAGFGAEVRRRVMVGTYVLSAGYHDAYYLQAQKVRTLIARDFAAAFADADVLLTPATPSAAFALGAQEDPLAMYQNDVFTAPANLAGLPAISVPAGLDDRGLPLGLQLIGRALDEAVLLRAAAALEDAAGFCARPRDWWTAP